MRRWVERSRWILVGSLLLAVAVAYLARASATQPRSETEHWFQGLTVHAISLDLTHSAMASLAREPRSWVRAKFVLDRGKVAELGVRFKGHRSLRGWASKPAFKLDFARYDKQQRYAGLRSVSLNNMVDDPTMLREFLGARVYAALRVPAPRTSFAELRVNGRSFGLYAIVEEAGESLLARHFGAASGPVFEGEYGCDLYPDDVWALEQDAGDDSDRAQLEVLAKRMRTQPVSEWFSSFEQEKVLSYLAASNWLADFDGYRHAHNYHLYRDPSTQLWSFLPWGFDRILKKPFPIYESQGTVAQSCFADSRCRLQYTKRLFEAVSQLEQLDLGRLIDQAEVLLHPVIARDPRRPYTLTAHAQALTELRSFVATRPQTMRAQLGCWNGSEELDADADGAGCMDCNDRDSAVHPGAAEVCDGIDNDCSGQVDDAVSCSCRTVQVGAEQFRACTLPKSYWDAEQLCIGLGASLARIDSKAELQALSSGLATMHKGEWWLGLSDQGHEADYRFSDGSAVGRNLWLEGEPDHYACGQHCAALVTGKKPGLRDQHCATSAAFVCGAPLGAALAAEP